MKGEVEAKCNQTARQLEMCGATKVREGAIFASNPGKPGGVWSSAFYQKIANMAEPKKLLEPKLGEREGSIHTSSRSTKRFSTER